MSLVEHNYNHINKRSLPHSFLEDNLSGNCLLAHTTTYSYHGLDTKYPVMTCTKRTVPWPLEPVRKEPALFLPNLYEVKILLTDFQRENDTEFPKEWFSFRKYICHRETYGRMTNVGETYGGFDGLPVTLVVQSTARFNYSTQCTEKAFLEYEIIEICPDNAFVKQIKKHCTPSEGCDEWTASLQRESISFVAAERDLTAYYRQLRHVRKWRDPTSRRFGLFVVNMDMKYDEIRSTNITERVEVAEHNKILLRTWIAWDKDFIHNIHGVCEKKKTAYIWRCLRPQYSCPLFDICVTEQGSMVLKPSEDDNDLRYEDFVELTTILSQHNLLNLVPTSLTFQSQIDPCIIKFPGGKSRRNHSETGPGICKYNSSNFSYQANAVAFRNMYLQLLQSVGLIRDGFWCLPDILLNIILFEFLFADRQIFFDIERDLPTGKYYMIPDQKFTLSQAIVHDFGWTQARFCHVKMETTNTKLQKTRDMSLLLNFKQWLLVID